MTKNTSVDSQEASRNKMERCDDNFDWQLDETIKLAFVDKNKRVRGKASLPKQNLADNAKRLNRLCVRQIFHGLHLALKVSKTSLLSFLFSFSI